MAMAQQAQAAWEEVEVEVPPRQVAFQVAFHQVALVDHQVALVEEAQEEVGVGQCC